jgi:hypothetical protein
VICVCIGFRTYTNIPLFRRERRGIIPKKIKGIEVIPEKLALDFYGPPEECPKERDLVHIKSNGEELMGTVHEVKNNKVMVMVKVLYHQ